MVQEKTEEKTENKVLPRTFNKVELQQIKDVKEFMKHAFDVRSWNHLRKQAQEIWDEKIISAVDGLRKWIIVYDKSNKTRNCIGMKF